jgi:beta-lactam-binding protein with PASTA domain
VISEPRITPRFMTEVAVEALGGAIAAIAIGWLGQLPALVGLVGGAVVTSRIEPKAAALLQGRGGRRRTSSKPNNGYPARRNIGKPGSKTSRYGKRRRPSLRSSLLVTGTAILLVLSSFTLIDLARGESLIGDRHRSFIPDKPKPTTLAIPRVTGFFEHEARGRLEGAGFRVERRYQSSVKQAGVVISTTPGGGEVVEKGSLVTMAVSLGSGTLIPDVQGQFFDTARTTLEARGFTVRREDAFHNAVEREIVIRSEPEGGLRAERGSMVTVTVSLGPSVQVPDVKGMSVDQARATLVAQGFGVETADDFDDVAVRGTVIGSEPESEQIVAKDSVVKIVVSLGPGRQVPDVGGMVVGQATTVLSAAGFAVRRAYEFHPIVPRDRVLRSDPARDMTIAKGSVVTIVVSRGPVIQVPPSTGPTKANP